MRGASDFCKGWLTPPSYSYTLTQSNTVSTYHTRVHCITMQHTGCNNRKGQIAKFKQVIPIKPRQGIMISTASGPHCHLQHLRGLRGNRGDRHRDQRRAWPGRGLICRDGTKNTKRVSCRRASVSCVPDFCLWATPNRASLVKSGVRNRWKGQQQRLLIPDGMLPMQRPIIHYAPSRGAIF